MKSDIPEKVADTLREIGMTPKQAGWNCHGTYVLLHKALEKVAVHRKIVFKEPTILECNSEKKVVSLLVTGTMGDKSEWSIGEASPSNNKNSYPYAMAEKRAKDRVILKLVGLHGDVYAEDEADAFKEERPDEIKGGTLDNGSEEEEKTIGVTDIKTEKVQYISTKKGAEEVKEIFLTFMPDTNIDELRSFKNSNAKALTALKEFDPNVFGEVSKAFIERADKLKSQQKESRMSEEKKEYPPSGTLFMSKNKRSDRSPDYTGQFELSYDVIEDLVRQMKDGVKKPQFNISGWKKYSNKTGTSFLSLRANIYDPPNKDEEKKEEKPKEDFSALEEITF